MADDKELNDALDELLRESDLESDTQRSLMHELEDKLGRPVAQHKSYIKGRIDQFLRGESNEEATPASKRRKGDPEETAGLADRPVVEHPVSERGAASTESAVPSTIELGGKKRAEISSFRGMSLLSLREFYEKDGAWLPGKKGISLTKSQVEPLLEASSRLSDALASRDTSVSVGLSAKRKATISSFRGRFSLDIREWYEKDGKELPGNKGLSLTPEQWDVLQENLQGLFSQL